MSTVAIVGGGPVGLFLALSLHRLGITPHVFERREGPRPASRSIGIHPPSLELLAELGLADRFVALGVQVRRVEAHGERGRLGTLDFASCRPPYRFVLTLPQAVTEGLLREALEARAPGCIRNAYVRSVEAHGVVHTADGRSDAYSAVIGCDGVKSAVREQLVGDPVRVSGHVVYRAVVDVKDFPEDLRWNAPTVWAGPNCHLVHYPLRHGEQYNIVVTFHSRKPAMARGCHSISCSIRWPSPMARAPSVSSCRERAPTEA